VLGPARLLVLAGPSVPDLEAVPGWPGSVSWVEQVSPEAHGALESAMIRALDRPGLTVLVAVAPCQMGAPRAPPLRVDPRRCNRCGACLSLGCPALQDLGGEAVSVAPATCVGCDRCAPLCRGRALGR
jgi:indolepyruvate ferredoxin oxidoreductase alpha subunit